MEKHYVWGFPGIGKSSVRSNLRVVDADCERFKFVLPESTQDSLHQGVFEGVRRNSSYPQNYLDYICSVDADIVLLNCHISLLEALDTDRLLLVYPSPPLKEEYLRRYAQRGDNGSYLRYMETAFDEIIAAARDSPYRKYEINDQHICLQNLIEKGTIMDLFMTKNDLANLLDECIQLGVYMPDDATAGKTPDELAQMLFDGHLSLDIGSLRDDLATQKTVMEQEQLLRDRRGGLNHEELSRKIMEGIVNGALNIRHCEAEPYSYGYEVSFHSDKHETSRCWRCYCSLPNVAEQITCSIETTALPMNITALLDEIASAERDKITSFVPECDSGLEPRGYHTGHVASALDVHRGIALDGIILGHFQGDYSSITTGTQNDTVRALVALKGFCLDCVHKLPSRPLHDFVVGYLKGHGTDISTPEKLDAWIRENPDKCGLPQNRVRAPRRQKVEHLQKHKRNDQHER